MRTVNFVRNLIRHILPTLLACIFAVCVGTEAHAGGGPIAHDIDFTFTDFSVTGTRRLPLGFNLQEVDTRIDFELSPGSVSTGNTIIREDGDGDLVLELGERTFVESSFTLHVDITITDIDSTFNFADSLGGPALGLFLKFEDVQFLMIDDPFVSRCSVGFGAFGGCGVLIDTDDYDLDDANTPLPLGIDVNGDMVDDEITTRTIPGSNEQNVPGLEISFLDNPDTTINNGTVTQDYIVTLEWLININPDVDIALTGLATVETFDDPQVVVPIPAAAVLFTSAMLGLGATMRRRSKAT